MYYEDGFLPNLRDEEEVCCGNYLVNTSDLYQTNNGFNLQFSAFDRSKPNINYSGNKIIDTLCKLPKLKLLEDQLKETCLESSDEECVLERPSERVPSEESSRPQQKLHLFPNPDPPLRLGPFPNHDNALLPDPCLPPRHVPYDHRPINGGLIPKHGLLSRPPHEQMSMNNNLLLEQGPPQRNPPYSPVEQRGMNNGMEPNFSPGNPNQPGFHNNQRPFNKFNNRGRTRNQHPNRDRGFRNGNHFNNQRMNGDHPPLNHQPDVNNFDRNFNSRPNRTRMHQFENHQNERIVNGRGNFSNQRGPKYFRSDNNGPRDLAFGQPKFQRGEQQFNQRRFRGRRR